MSQEQLATQQFRSAEWSRIIQERTTSGLTISEYCEQAGVSETAYYYWLRKLRRVAMASSGVELVEIKEPDAQPSLSVSHNYKGFVAEATISAGALSISVNSSTPRELIRTLMEVAAHVE